MGKSPIDYQLIMFDGYVKNYQRVDRHQQVGGSLNLGSPQSSQKLQTDDFQAGNRQKWKTPRSGIVQKWDIQMVANNGGRAGTQTKWQELYENSMITPQGGCDWGHVHPWWSLNIALKWGPVAKPNIHKPS